MQTKQQEIFISKKMIIFLGGFTALMLLAPFLAAAEDEITKIGIVDTSKIYTLYFKDSKSLRDLGTFKENIIQESKKIEDEINKLKERKLKATQTGDDAEILRLNNLIAEKERYLNEFKQIKNKEYQAQISRLQIEDSFMQEISEAISNVAISYGYSIILEKNNNFFLYYSLDIDITDKVIEYLQKNK
jgi:outer membrane protein